MHAHSGSPLDDNHLTSLLLYPSVHSLSPDNAMESERKSLDAAQKGKNHENKSLMGPLKSLGVPGKYPPPPLSGPGHATVVTK